MSKPKNRIDFSLSHYAFADSKRAIPTVDVVIDGRSLYDLVNGGDPEPVRNGVPGRPPTAVAPPATVWAGGADGTEYDDGRTLVLDCECGSAGCGGTFARIDFGDDTVTWSEVGRTADKSFGPFTFDRSQYEDAVSRLANA